MPRRMAYSGALTAREWDVVRAVGRGRLDKEIAAELGIGFSTVRTHLEHIFPKAGVRNRAELMLWAREHEEGPAAGP